MSYLDYLAQKRERDARFVAAVHGDAHRFGDVVPRINEVAHYDPRPSPPPSGEPREIGWSPEVEIEDGAYLIFPWLEGER